MIEGAGNLRRARAALAIGVAAWLSCATHGQTLDPEQPPPVRAKALAVAVSTFEGIAPSERRLLVRALEPLPEREQLVQVLLTDFTTRLAELESQLVPRLEKAMQAADPSCELQRLGVEAVRQARESRAEVWEAVAALAADPARVGRLRSRSDRERFLAPAGYESSDYPGGIDLVAFCHDDIVVGGLLADEGSDTRRRISELLADYSEQMAAAIVLREEQTLATSIRLCETKDADGRPSRAVLKQAMAAPVSTDQLSFDFARRIAAVIGESSGVDATILFLHRFLVASYAAFLQPTPSERRLLAFATAAPGSDDPSSEDAQRRQLAIRYANDRVMAGIWLHEILASARRKGLVYTGDFADPSLRRQLANRKTVLDDSLVRYYRAVFRADPPDPGPRRAWPEAESEDGSGAESAPSH